MSPDLTGSPDQPAKRHEKVDRKGFLFSIESTHGIAFQTNLPAVYVTKSVLIKNVVFLNIEEVDTVENIL